ncbi:MAG TPA: FtsX-like permease family protein [Bacteroidota bacterium]|nr:FtsX-like permease family protein [Bacteroidota bacterium]
MFVLKLVLKNALRHKLRTILTIVGIAIAVMSFGFLRTVVTAWSYGVEASAANRMITRASVSFIFPLPYAYRDQIARVPGVTHISYANWFQGAYKDPADFKNFFPRLAIDPDTYFDVYQEYLVSEQEMKTFRAERNSCIVGQKIAREHGFAIGDIITVDGDIYPGRWDFVVRGIYKGRDATADETQMFFHWNYLNERIRELQPSREGNVGWYIFTVNNPAEMSSVARTIDAMYLNSRAGTKTETEREFQQGFVSMSSAIIRSLEIVSFIIIGIILLVLANTIVMAARERTTEYAVLKTIGFSPGHIIGLIGGESLLIAGIGGALGLALTFPVAGAFASMFPTFFPVFTVETITIILAALVAALAGVVAALFPTIRALRTSIAEGLRAIG